MPTLAYVASADLIVIDTSTNTIMDTIATFAYPTGIAISPNGNFVYVTNDVANNVAVIYTCDNTVIDNIQVGEYPNGIAITPNGKFVYVANTFSNTVSVIDTIYDIVVATIPVGTFPEGVAISPNGNFAYVTNTMSNTISVIETDTNTVTDTIPVGAYPVSIITATNNFIYVGIEDPRNENITVIDFYTNKVVDIIPLNGVPTSLAITPNNAYVYVTIGDLNTVDVVFTGSDRVVASVEVGTTPFGVAITPDGSFAYVANVGSDNISVIDTSSKTVVDTVPAYAPVNVAIANIPPCPAPSERICIETTRVFGSSKFIEQHAKKYRFLNWKKKHEMQCEISDTKSKILEVRRIAGQQNLVDIKIRFKVFLNFKAGCAKHVYKRVMCFEKSIILIAPEGADVSCEILNARCKCVQADNEDCKTNSYCCTVDVRAVLKSKKLVQIQIPYFGECNM